MKHRWVLKVPLVFLITVIGVILLFTLIINFPFGRRFINNRANSILSGTGIPVHIGSIRKISFSSINLQEILLSRPENDTIIYAEDARISIVPSALLKKKLKLTGIIIRNARVILLKDTGSGKLNISEAFSKVRKDTIRKSEKRKPGWKISANRAELSDVLFQMKDPVSGTYIDQQLNNIRIRNGALSVSESKMSIQSFELSGVTGQVTSNPHLTRLKFLAGYLSGKGIETGFKARYINFRKLSLSHTGITYIKRCYPGAAGSDQQYNLSDSIAIGNLNLNLSDTRLKKDTVCLELTRLGFESGNGFLLKEMKGSLNSYAGSTNLNFSLESGNSIFQLEGKAQQGLSEILSKPDKIQNAEFIVRKARISLDDLLCFKPDLRVNPVFKMLGSSPVELEGDFSIDESEISIKDISLSEKKLFGIKIKGKAQNLFQPEKLNGELQFTIGAKNFDALNEAVHKAGIESDLPELKSLSLTGTISGSLKSPGFNISCITDKGEINMLGTINLPDSSFSAKTLFKSIKTGSLLNNPDLGSLSGSMEIKGMGLKRNTITGNLNVRIDSVHFKGYSYTNASIDCKVDQEKLDAHLLVGDPYLKTDLQTLINMKGSMIDIKSKGNFQADLNRLGLIKDTLSLEGDIDGIFQRDYGVTESGIKFSDIKLSTPRQISRINMIDLNFNADSSKCNLSGKADFINISLSVNKPSGELNTAIKEFGGYLKSLRDKYSSGSSGRPSIPFGFDARMNLSYNSAFGLLFRDTTLSFKDLDLSIAGRTNDSTIRCNINGSSVKYKTIEIGNLSASLLDSAADLNVSVNAENCRLFSYPSCKIILNSSFSDSRGKTSLSMLVPGDIVEYSLELRESVDSGNIIISVPSKQLTIHGINWQLDEPDVVTFKGNPRKVVPSLRMHTANSFLNLFTDNTGKLPKHICELGNVALSSLIKADVIKGNPEGFVSGRMEFGVDSNQAKEISTDLQLTNISWSDLNYNKISINGSFVTTSSRDYNLDVSALLDSGEIRITANKSVDGTRNINARLKSVPVRTAQPFVKKFLSDLNGNISGEFNLSTGNGNESLTGDLLINDGSLRINQLNSFYRLPDSKIRFKDKGIVFDKFIIRDSLNNELSVDGIIDFSNRHAVFTDLQINTANLQIMNTREEETSSFYGNIFVNSQLSIKGPLASSALRGKIFLTRGTDIYFSQKENLNLTESEKIITFTGKDPAAGQEARVTGPGKSIYDKISVESVVEIDPETRINIRLAKKMFDIDLGIKGGGELNYNMLVNSQVNLTGKYEVNEGLMNLKMIGWPNKAFQITKGGFIRWDGKLEDPELQFEAVNTVRSSYKSPMDNKDKFVDFNVSLKLANRLSAMDVLFTISTNDQYLMSIINTLSREEQMRQAITILLFEKIDLPGISTSSNYMTEQVNQMVASQLNQLTRTTIKGIDISFGIDSYVRATETGGKETKTSLSYQVNRSLLNDRAKIKLSGRINNMERQSTSSDISLNNLSFEYRLDSAATKFLKVYNEHTYEDVFEGEVTKTGIGLTYRKSYPTLKDIWKKDEKKIKPGKKHK